ncbi:MAG: phosphate regulon sensor histidine kinase PhoR [Methylococcales bacterium]
MHSSYWTIEYWRITLVLFIAVLGGMLSGYWQVSLTVSLIGYIAWLLYKLHQLQDWLKKGAKSLHYPDSNGIWERITQQIQSVQKKNNVRKKTMTRLLRRSQDIISGLPYATVVLNGHNEIDWANKTSAEYLNIKTKKDRGQRIDNLLRLPALYKLLSKNTHDEIEVSLPQSGGRKLALQLIPIQHDLKLLIAQDISERAHIQQMRKNFIANASHELKTPLTVIAGYLEIMSSDENLPEHMQTAVQSASDQSARMQLIIEDLLTLSRLENSELNNKSNTIIDMSTILQDLCDEQSKLILGNTHTIETDIDSGLSLNGSEAEIISVCSNLIQNAIRHTKNGTQIKVEWKKMSSGRACFTVRDNGQGIAMEHIAHLTERFYRVDKGRSQGKGGTGLGLAIVQHIILRHGGKLSIRSAVGKGSTFAAFFPVDRVVEALDV